MLLVPAGIGWFRPFWPEWPNFEQNWSEQSGIETEIFFLGIPFWIFWIPARFGQNGTKSITLTQTFPLIYLTLLTQIQPKSEPLSPNLT